MIADILGLDRAEVLVALYNAAVGRTPSAVAELTVEDAGDLLADGTMSFGYLNGRALQVNLRFDDLHTAMYNRHNGHNAAENAVLALRQQKRVAA